jgi:hypothetical protein
MNKLRYEIIPLSSIVIGCIGSVFFGGAAFVSIFCNLTRISKMNTESWVFMVVALIFFSFFLLSLLLVLYCQKIVITEDGVGIKRMTKYYALLYSEISFFYENAGNINMGSASKQISFPAYEYWNGRDKDEAYVLLIAKLEERNIHREVSLKGLVPRIKGFN